MHSFIHSSVYSFSHTSGLWALVLMLGPEIMMLGCPEDCRLQGDTCSTGMSDWKVRGGMLGR